MIWTLITGLLGDFWPYIAAGVTALLAFAGMWLKAGSAANDRLLRKQAEDAAKKTDKGRREQAKAGDDLRDGKTPEDIVRENDQKWNG